MAQLRNVLAKTKTIDEIDKALEDTRLIRITSSTARTKKRQTETDCRKVVAETELEDHLTEGWHVEAVLPSGKIVISNEE